MSTSREPSGGRGQIRNAAQRERRRILNREHQRLRRQKAKQLSDTTREEMPQLRQDLTLALGRLDRLCQLVETHEVSDHLIASKPTIRAMEGVTSGYAPPFPVLTVPGEFRIPTNLIAANEH